MRSQLSRLSLVGLILVAAGACVTDATGETPTEPDTAIVDGGAGVEPEVDVADISPMLESAVQADGLPAMGAAIVDANGVFALGVFGNRSKEEGASAVAAADVWHLGSDTKAMTAVVAARLVEAGTIDWSTAVTDVWPDADAGWASSSLAMLLQHRAGATGSIPGTYPQAWSNLFQSESQAGRTAFV